MENQTENVDSNLTNQEKVALRDIMSHFASASNKKTRSKKRKGFFNQAIIVVVLCVAVSLYFYTTRDPEVAPNVSKYILRGLPDPDLTPGIMRGTQPAISEQQRKSVLAAYGIKPNQSEYVVVPLIPEGLGGAVNEENLFATTKWFANLKARVDKEVMQQVMRGDLEPDEARRRLADNWLNAMHTERVRNYGQDNKANASKIESDLHWGKSK